jgi:PPP family 3-phenylpropionic acid transporter
MLPYWRLSAYYFFYFAFVGTFAPYFSLYLKSLSFSAWDIGVLNSLMPVMRVAAPNLWSWLAERIGAQTPIVRLAGLMSVVGFSLLFFTRSFAGVFFAMALMSFFWSAAIPLVDTLTLSHLGSQAQRYGRIRLWGSIGFIVAVLAVGAALDAMPIAGLLPMTMTTLVGIFVCALLMPEAPKPPHQSDHSPIADILRRAEVRALFVACFFMSAAHGALYVFYSLFLVGNGYSTAAVGWLWTLGVLAEIGVFIAMPHLLRLFTIRSMLLFSFACAVARFLIIGWFVESAPLLVLAQLLHGATFGAYHAAAVAAVGHWFGTRHQSRGQAIYGSVSFGAGGMTGGLVSGLTWDWVGPAATYSISSLFALIGLAVILVSWRPSAQSDGR